MRARTVVAMIVARALISAKGNEFNVRYNGGSIKTKVSPHDWDNKLAITSETIILDTVALVSVPDSADRLRRWSVLWKQPRDSAVEARESYHNREAEWVQGVVAQTDYGVGSDGHLSATLEK